MYRVVYTVRSRRESLDTFHWLAERSLDAAEKWLGRLEAAIAELAGDPSRNPVAEEESEVIGVLLRQSSFGSRKGMYRILYSVAGDVVTVHSVRHAARGPFTLDED